MSEMMHPGPCDHTCVVCGTVAHKATKIGLLCERHLANFSLCCDFCSREVEVEREAWRYPAQPFHMVTGEMSGAEGDADWLACGECHSFISAHAWEKLADKCLAAELSGIYRIVARELMLALHGQFDEHRTGDPIRIGSA